MDSPKISKLDHLVLTVADIDAAIGFYTKALGMEQQSFKAADGTVRYALGFGHEKINLHRAGAEFEPKAQRPGPGTADLCFLTHDPLQRWIDHLTACGISIEEGPVPRTGATGPIQSIYLRDPDGNLIEIGAPV